MEKTMDLVKYQELTGITVPTNQITSVEAQIKRVRVRLEGLLGWPLLKSKVSINHYDELGKSATECDFDGDALNDPDDVVNAYRLFRFDKSDQYLKVDPFIRLHSAKLVFLRPVEPPNGVTVQTLDDIRVHTVNGVSKYIERCQDCLCRFDCEDCVQLAVDADWLYEDCLPEDLLYLWADAVSYEIDCKKDIKSETLGTHSYTKFDRQDPLIISASVVKKYAGANGL